MKIHSITLATKAKGLPAFLKRGRSLVNRYGLTPNKMDQALQLLVQTLQRFDCAASIALTAVVLERNVGTIAKYIDQNIEFVVHGYTHIDYSQLSLEEQLEHLNRARKIFAAANIAVTGFRSPYLRQDVHLNMAIENSGFSYVCNQPVMWDVVDVDAFISSTCSSYERALGFYAPWSASERPSLPRLCGNLVEIPVSLPDDEILIDRLDGTTGDLVEQTWQRILAETYQRGELFTLQLHPERMSLCLDGLSSVLTEARALTPSVWIARLDEIGAWWRARVEAQVDVRQADAATWRLSVAGPSGVTILTRGVQVDEPTQLWDGGYRRAATMAVTVRSDRRPFIGVSTASPLTLGDFLRQQGYIIQVEEDDGRFSIYLDRPNFAPENELAVLMEIENSNEPLIRLGRWPYGARSALSVTGDIDALTLWDYVLRLCEGIV